VEGRRQERREGERKGRGKEGGKGKEKGRGRGIEGDAPLTQIPGSAPELYEYVFPVGVPL